MHFTVHAPDEDGGEVLVFDSLKKAPRGVRFTLGETLHAEVRRASPTTPRPHGAAPS